MKILIANNAKALAVALGEYPSTATVEAEYGDDVVTGSVATLVHHGRYKDRPAPCIAKITPPGCLDAIGISHVDLDTLGGILGLLGRRRDDVLDGDGVFWRVVADVDLHGPHRLEMALRGARNEYVIEAKANLMDHMNHAADGAIAEAKRALQAFWAWSEAHRIYAPRDGSVEDVTERVLETCKAVEMVLVLDGELLAAGDAWSQAQADLNKASYVGTVRFDPDGPGVVVRTSDTRFCNHLYDTPDGAVEAAVVNLNTDRGAITISLADPVQGVSCQAIVQKLWGPEAGGRDVIAGSPRGQEMTAYDRNDVAAVMAFALASQDH